MLPCRRAVALLLWAVLALPSQKVGAQGISFESEKALTQYRVDRWQTDQGLPLDTVQAIAQTRDGYLWVGTAGGLARFDGVQFETWPAAIASLSIFALMEDSAGALWIGHGRGAAIYRNGQIALNFLEGAAVIARAQQVRTFGVPVPPSAFEFRPVQTRRGGMPFR